jgi:hypothetical protein
LSFFEILKDGGIVCYTYAHPLRTLRKTPINLNEGADTPIEQPSKYVTLWYHLQSNK